MSGCRPPAVARLPAGLTIAPAGRVHAELCAALQAEAFGAARTAWPATAWTNWLEAPGVAALLARCDTVPLGLTLGRVVAGEGEVLSLAVVAAVRRRGLGRALLARLATALADLGAARLTLEVAADNRAALALYGDAGFRAVGRRPGYYPAGDAAMDALILERTAPITRNG